MADYLVIIAVDTYGNFSISPSALHVNPTTNDRVGFQCTSPFVVQFQEGTPLANMIMQGMPGNSPPYIYSTPLINVNDEAQGNYHYAVAVFDGTYVRIDAGCPVVVAN